MQAIEVCFITDFDVIKKNGYKIICSTGEKSIMVSRVFSIIG